MKIKQTSALPPALSGQLQALGARIARLRIARGVLQTDAAIRAGLSRSTAVAIEKGSPSVAVGQIARYVDAIAPGKTLTGLLIEPDPAEVSLAASERRSRARTLARSDLKRLDF